MAMRTTATATMRRAYGNVEMSGMEKQLNDATAFPASSTKRFLKKCNKIITTIHMIDSGRSLRQTESRRSNKIIPKKVSEYLAHHLACSRS